MDRRRFIGTCAGSLLAVVRIVDAQQTAKLPVLGVLSTGGGQSRSIPALFQGLRDLGYVDGKNIVIDDRSAGGNPNALPRLAAEFVQRKVDVVYATGPAAVKARLPLLKTLAAKGTLIAGAHMPFLGFGRMRKVQDGYSWEPVSYLGTP